MDAKIKSKEVLKPIPLSLAPLLLEQEVAACLSHIDVNKAPGPHGLKGKVLKVCGYQHKCRLKWKVSIEILSPDNIT